MNDSTSGGILGRYGTLKAMRELAEREREEREFEMALREYLTREPAYIVWPEHSETLH